MLAAAAKWLVVPDGLTARGFCLSWEPWLIRTDASANAEQAVLDPVPLRRSRRKVADPRRQAGLVGQILRFDPEQPHPRPLAAAAIGRDQQPLGVRIAPPAHQIEPAADRVDRERAVPMSMPTLTRPALAAMSWTPIGSSLRAGYRHHVAKFGIDEILRAVLVGTALRSICLTFADLAAKVVAQSVGVPGRGRCRHHGGTDGRE
jgi:hypothetical protein